MEMKNKNIESNNFELNRQLFHLGLGIAIVLLLMNGFVDKNMILALIIFGFSAIFCILLFDKANFPKAAPHGCAVLSDIACN